MKLNELFAALLPKKDSESSTDNSASTESGASSASSLQRENLSKVEQVVRKSTETDKAASFRLAFNQGNIAMMELLVEVGGYKPSPEMKNDKGVPLKQWLADQSRGMDEQTRLMAGAIDRKLDSPKLALPLHALEQVHAIQGQAAGYWANMVAESRMPSVQRGHSLGMAL